jgi:hypothetical protein
MAPSTSPPERPAALTLLTHRIQQLPGCEVLGHSHEDGVLVMTIDVRGTGMSARQVARMVRMLSGVELQVRGRHVVAIAFPAPEDLADAGTRLLFGLSHAGHAPGLRTGSALRVDVAVRAEVRYARDARRPPTPVGAAR